MDETAPLHTKHLVAHVLKRGGISISSAYSCEVENLKSVLREGLCVVFSRSLVELNRIGHKLLKK